MNLKIGIDFDNTIVSYDRVFHQYALQRHWIDSTVPVSKNSVRNSIREKLGNEVWIKLQAIVYGDGMKEAEFTPGAEAFLRWCQKQSIPFYIISHKTQYAAIDRTKDLRKSAMDWMKTHGFFSQSCLDLKLGEQIFFEATREEKFERMKSCGITHFIDDLQEVLLDHRFPYPIEPIYYNPRYESYQGNLRSFATWNAISDYLSGINEMSLGLADFFKSKFDEMVDTSSTIGSGPNRRSYKIRTNRNTYFVKSYSLRHEDPRKPWINEFRSLNFLIHHHFDNIPVPILLDEEKKISVFSFINGSHFDVNEISQADIDKVLAFFVELQKYRSSALEHNIQSASEAFFSIDDHLHHIHERLTKLSLSKHRAFAEFFKGELTTTWSEVKDLVVSEAKQSDYDISQTLPSSSRVLSPSDVGFHNILKEEKTGKLIFIDFEYFGFDDPIKMMCDFMLEPALPLPKSLKNMWIKKFSIALNLTANDQARFKLLYPIISFKWCLIVLNVFLNGAEESILRKQLEKSKEMIEGLQTELKSFVH